MDPVAHLNMFRTRASPAHMVPAEARCGATQAMYGSVSSKTLKHCKAGNAGDARDWSRQTHTNAAGPVPS